MLYLSRKVGQTICVGNNIRLTVIEVSGDKVRIGIEAPPDVPVHRQEIYEMRLRDNTPTIAEAPQD